MGFVNLWENFFCIVVYGLLFFNRLEGVIWIIFFKNLKFVVKLCVLVVVSVVLIVNMCGLN